MPRTTHEPRVPARHRLNPFSRFFSLLSNPSLGARGERAAAQHLKAAGYRILGRNLRTPLGEVDLLAVATDGRTLVVTEVKTSCTDNSTPGRQAYRPEVRVNRAKQRRLVALGAYLVRKYRLKDRPVRFDVIGVDLPPKGKPAIRHHRNAFESHV